MSVPERRAMVERPGENLPVRRPCELLNLARSGVSGPARRWPNTTDACFRSAAFGEAVARHGAPKIFNRDRGAQFPSAAFTGRLEAAGIAISMDGRGRFMDNIFIERLWRSIKYEEVQ